MRLRASSGVLGGKRVGMEAICAQVRVGVGRAVLMDSGTRMPRWMPSSLMKMGLGMIGQVLQLRRLRRGACVIPSKNDSE